MNASKQWQQSTALLLTASYLSNTTFTVTTGNSPSSSANTTCAVPPGAIICLIHSFPHAPPRRPKMRKASFHCCASDARLRFLLKTNDPTTLDILRKWLHDVKCWVSQNWLPLSDIRPEVMLCLFKQRGLPTLLGGCSQRSDFSGWGYECNIVLILTFGNISKSSFSSQPTL